MIHIITGTKAQLIKMAPILRLLRDKNIEYNHISTGQHRATMDEISLNFGIKKPDRELYTGKDITSIFNMFIWSIRILIITFFRRKKIFRHDINGIVLVHGDTLSTVLGSLMGKIAGLKVGHVESGLRSNNFFQPFPEEIFRLITFRLADIFFCPGNKALRNINKLNAKIIVNTKENSLLDSLRMIYPIINQIDDIQIPSQKFGVVSLHRFENFNNRSSILKIVNSILQIAKNHHIVFILHKFTAEKLKKYGFMDLLLKDQNIEFRPRYDYLRFIRIVNESIFLVSDGGSNQEECYYLGKPLLILRNVSERDEGLGRNALLSRFNSDSIQYFINNINKFKHPYMEVKDSPSEIIVNCCLKYR